MSVYRRYVLPRLTDLVMRNKADAEERAKLIPLASGVVLEIGIGSALNLRVYGPSVEKVYGVDPSYELWKIGRRHVEAARFPVEFLRSSAERIPLADALVDTVVSTWTLCTIPDTTLALAEIKRVLKPGGQLLFVEHGLAPDPSVRAWQDRLTPTWKRVAGGCHMNREIDRLIGAAGFHFRRLETGYASVAAPSASPRPWCGDPVATQTSPPNRSVCRPGHAGVCSRNG
jgi:ubiquinone/menaquinone biosynthesis C-methylase UbiE